MIVPAITAGLALLNLVSAVAPAHVRRQTVNASPAQALAASVQANAVISQIIIVIVQQAAAAAAAISSASVARTAVAATTTFIASVSSTTSASSSTPSPTCYDTGANSLQIPTILNLPNLLVGTPCYSACQNAIALSAACTAAVSTAIVTLQCSCSGNFLQSLSQCAVCQDSINGVNVGFFIQRYQSQCNTCAIVGFQDIGGSSCPIVPTLPNCATTTSPTPASPSTSVSSTAPVVSSSTTTTTTTIKSTTSSSSSISSTSSTTSTSSISSTSTSSTSSISRSSSLTSSAAPAPTCVAPAIVKIDANPLSNIVAAVSKAPPCNSICGIMNTAISNCAALVSTSDQAACACSTQFINQAEACSVCLDAYLGKSTLNYGNATSLCLSCSNGGYQPTGLSVCGSNTDLTFCGLNPVQDPVHNDLIPLGSAGSYSVFTLTGISTVPGTVAAGQVVNGDIGVAPIALTAITGFGAVQEGKSNTLFVTGNIHGPPYSTNTPADIVNAYNVAAGKTPSGAIVTGAGTLDSGVVMTPGVYRWTGALALGVGQTLTLNGQCGDIFIFQTAGAITTGANSQVLLTGGLTAATVYWVSATSLTTGVSSAFSGIILAKTNVVIAGTLVGAVYAQTETALHAATISAPIATFATTQIGSICNIATCAVNYGLLAGACVQCQAGYVSAGGTSTCKPCATGVNFINKLGACVACTTGTLSCDINTGFALSCSPGYSGSSTTACTGCTPGFASPGGIVTPTNNACTGCSAGFYAASKLSVNCIACPGKAGTDYATCASDTGNDITCPAGLALGSTTKSGSTTICNACLDGYFSLNSAVTCTQCSVGTSTCSATTGYGTACLAGYGSTSNSPCSACLGGTYSTSVGTTCSQVPAGSFALGPAATSYSSCAPTGKSAAGASKCDICSPGSPSTDNGLSCSICADGTHFLDPTNQNTCTPCSKGTISCDLNGYGISCSPGYGTITASSSCTLCTAGTYSTSNTCQSCTNGTTWSNQGQTSCNPCADIYTAAVLTCKIDTGKPTSCAPGYQLTGGDYPYCQIACPVGSGIFVNSNNTATCVPCVAGFYNDQQNSCTRCGDFTWSHANSTVCIPCIYDANTMTFASCDPTNGNPTYCKYGLAGLTKTPLPSPKACVFCLYGYSVAGFSNDCQCQAGYTNVTTTPCLNGTAPVSFDTARIYVTENNNGCKKQLGWLSQTATNGYSTDGSFFGYSLDPSKALQVRIPSSINGGLTAIKAVTPFGHGYSYLGIQMGSGTLGVPFSSYPLKRMTGVMSASQFVNPGSTFGELALANGVLEFGSIGENATADCWIVNPYDTCRNGYPLSLSLRIPATLGLPAFVSNNASFIGNGLILATPIDNIDFSVLNGNGNNGELQLTLVPN